MKRLVAVASLAGILATGGVDVRPWIVGSNPAEPVGSSVSDGYTGRLTDPSSGAGIFNPNTDPAVVGVDPLTGVEAPSGTDMSFGAPVIRQVLTGVINGDFVVLPPLGSVGSGDSRDWAIDSDPASATYNPLAGAIWTPPADGIGYVFPLASGNRNYLVFAAGPTVGTSTTGGSMAWPVVAPISTGQQYRALISVYTQLVTAPNATVSYQWYEPDGVTTVGSEVSVLIPTGATENKIDAGLVPPTAGRLRIMVKTNTMNVGQIVYVNEVRAAFLPAEASLGLGSITAASGNIDSVTGETVVKAITIPSYTFVVGSVYRITAWATVTSTVANAVTVRVRVGPTTLAGAIVTSTNPTATTTASNDSVRFEAAFTVRSEGPAGTVSGAISFVANESQPFTNGHRAGVDTGTTTIDTTVANLIELTAVTAGGNTDINFRQAYIECVMAS